MRQLEWTLDLIDGATSIAAMSTSYPASPPPYPIILMLAATFPITGSELL